MAPNASAAPRGAVFPPAPSNLLESLRPVPRAARWVLPAIAAALRGTEGSTLEPKVRALLLLRVASVDRSPYWRSQLESAAPLVGITDQELVLVESDEWETAPGFTDREHAAILWGDRVARRLARRDRRAYQMVREQFDETELVELTLVASLGAMFDRFSNALRIAPDPPTGLAPATDPVDEAELAAWSRRSFDPGSLDLARDAPG